jgi:hypothetical protein
MRAVTEGRRLAGSNHFDFGLGQTHAAAVDLPVQRPAAEYRRRQ